MYIHVGINTHMWGRGRGGSKWGETRKMVNIQTKGRCAFLPHGMSPNIPVSLKSYLKKNNQVYNLKSREAEMWVLAQKVLQDATSSEKDKPRNIYRGWLHVEKSKQTEKHLERHKDTRQTVSVPSGEGRGIPGSRWWHTPVLLSALVKFTAFTDYLCLRRVCVCVCVYIAFSAVVTLIKYTHLERKNLMRFSGVQADRSRTHCHVSRCPRPGEHLKAEPGRWAGSGRAQGRSAPCWEARHCSSDGWH